MVTPALKKALLNSDPVMKEIVSNLELPVHQSTNNVFYDLASCILEQQIHYRAKGVYMKKFSELSRGEVPSPKAIQSISAEDFEKKKISGKKYEALSELADYWTEHSLDMVGWSGLSEDEIRERLEPIKGVGSWTINMVMLYTLQHPDIFDPNDFQLKKAMKTAYGLDDDKALTKEMTEISENWKPYRSYGTRYLLEWGEYIKKQ